MSSDQRNKWIEAMFWSKEETKSLISSSNVRGAKVGNAAMRSSSASWGSRNNAASAVSRDHNDDNDNGEHSKGNRANHRFHRNEGGDNDNDGDAGLHDDDDGSPSYLPNPSSTDSRSQLLETPSGLYRNKFPSSRRVASGHSGSAPGAVRVAGIDATTINNDDLDDEVHNDADAGQEEQESVPRQEVITSNITGSDVGRSGNIDLEQPTQPTPLTPVQEEDEDEYLKYKGRKWICLVVVVLILFLEWVASGILYYAMKGGGDRGNNEPTSSPTIDVVVDDDEANQDIQASPEELQHLLDLLLRPVLELSGNAMVETWMLDPTTPYYETLEWLATSEKSKLQSQHENNDQNGGNGPEQDAVLSMTVTNELIQRFVLGLLYFSTNGENWIADDNWLSDGSPCLEQKGWFGVECSGDSVVHLILPRNGLAGTIVPELGLLTDLEAINLGFNDLSGPVPKELGNLSNLWGLQLGPTNGATLKGLNGTVPSELGNLSMLKILNAWRNDFSGTLPTELGQLSLLEDLVFESNENLSGSIPSEFADLSHLRELRLGQCNFSGTLPNLSGMTSLTVMYLSQNRIAGSFPSSLGELTNLETLNLVFNEMTGTLPSEIGLLSKLTHLGLQQNRFNGTIPTEIRQMQSLQKVHLDGNDFTGDATPVFCDQTDGSSLFEVAQVDCTPPFPEVDCFCCTCP